MARPFSFGGIELDVNAGDAVAVAEPETLLLKPEAEDPFRILVLGDFGGRARGFSRPLQVDRDNLNEVIRALEVQANISLADNATPFTLNFTSLEDFEPDSLFARCDLFRALEQTPQDVQPPKSSAAAAQRSVEANAARLNTGSLLDAIVEQHDTSVESPIAGLARSANQDELRQIIDRTIEPHLQPRQTSGALQAAAERKQRMNVLMRAILHEPHFQALEAAWRSLNFLIGNVENDSLVKVYLVDISKEKLASDLLDSSAFRDSDTYRAILEDSVRTPGAEPWALIVGNYGFDPNFPRDVDLLAKLGMLARAARAPFLAEAISPSDDNQEAFESWQALRRSSHASWLGLGIPRFLLRLPYGKTTTTVESFDFEEMPDAPQHQTYVWGNPAFGCAYLFALSFCEVGWNFRPGLHLEIGSLPLHVYKSQGVTRIQPCAEVLLSESECENLLDAGLMPLPSVKDRDEVRMIRFQSIAYPPSALSGRWV
ncbi:MAG TPA: type VI secretion system contractile sheath large subunit [Bryobacteraceae bacterium]|nr:type VI secretion system contractile sheath large subunit [Bryobacteraceae bacterium]